MRTLTYCKNWSGDARPNKVMTEARARRLHEQKKRFEIIVAEDGVDRYVIAASLETSCYLVYFLDEQKRAARVHIFDGSEDTRRLFVSRISARFYQGDGLHAPFDVIALYFDPDGSVWTPYADATGWKRRDLYQGLDVTDHYEPWPEFGQYDSLLRRKRSIPPGLGVEQWE